MSISMTSGSEGVKVKKKNVIILNFWLVQ